MRWGRLPDGRSYLPEGTIIRFSETGSCFRITAAPVGYGGSGILYPAVRVRPGEKGWEQEELQVALKECYPIVSGTVLERDETGAVSAGDNRIYLFASEQMRREKEITGKIYNRGFRLVPIVSCADEEEIAADGESFCPARNLYTLMERLDEKGISLGKLLQEEENTLTIWDMIRILIQVLASLKEVHESGFIHGDIQANNLFIKGYQLENSSSEKDQSLVSLIDFGAARKLEEDGKTVPIRDRALFTTEGYAPPECVYENDGTLRLDVTADLYAAGYLLLRMVTGKEIRRQALELVTNGTYLYQRRADRIASPPSVTAAVNRVLDKALQADRTKRYLSAGEMMEELERIERTLSPARSVIASTDYCAFISYCHSKENDRVAKMLQGALERYRIPRIYQTGRGKRNRSLGKVFLDTEELASSPDLEASLNEALEHSRFLIVLLSPETKESPWVAREIAQFLKTHTREQILTVLTGGSASEGLPELLQKQDVWRHGRHIKTEAEGLAADLRAAGAGERRKKLRTEILRLIAPMLGCGYDDLRQRQREYRTKMTLRVMTAAFLSVLLIAGIFAWQAHQIRIHYRQVQADQAKSLALEAEQLLAAGDRMGAVRTAMEALPESSGDKGKPLVLRAQAALSDAVDAYQGIFHRMYAFGPDRQLSMPADRSGMEALSPDGRYFLAVDTLGNICLWELESGKQVWRIESAQEDFCGELFYADFLDHETVFLAGCDGMRTVDLQKQISSPVPFPEGRYHDAQAQMCAMDEERELIAVWQSHEIYYTSDRLDYATGLPKEEAKGYSLGVYRISDGSVVWEDNGTEDYYEILNSFTSANAMCFSEDSRFLSVAIGDEAETVDTDQTRTAGLVIMVDLETETLQQYQSDRMNYFRLAYLEDGRLAVFGACPETAWEYFELPLDGEVCCLEPATGALLWVHKMTCQMRDGVPCGIFCDVASAGAEAGDDAGNSAEAGDDAGNGAEAGNEAGNGEEAGDARKERSLVTVWYHREVLVLDEETGEEVWSCTVPESICGIGQEGDLYLAGTATGKLYSLNLRSQYILPFGSGVSCDTQRFWYESQRNTCILAAKRDGVYTILRQPKDTRSQNVLLKMISSEGIHGTSVPASFPEMILKEGLSTEANTLHFLRLDTGEWMEPYRRNMRCWNTWILSDELVCIRWGALEGSGNMLEIYDINRAETIWEQSWENSFPEIKSLWRTDSTGKARGGICLFQEGVLHYVIPVEDGVEEREIPVMPEEDWHLEELSSLGGESFQGLTFRRSRQETGDSERIYRIVDWETGTVQEWDAFAGKVQGWNYQMLIGEDNRAAFYDDSSQQLYILDLLTKEIVSTIPIQLEAWHGYYVFADHSRKILLTGKDGFLRMYDTSTGMLLAKSEERFTQVYGITVSDQAGLITLEAFDDELREHIGSSWFSSQSVRWFYQIDEEGKLCRMGKIISGLYNEAVDRMVSVSLDEAEPVVRIWKRYTLDDLLDMGNELLR